MRFIYNRLSDSRYLGSLIFIGGVLGIAVRSIYPNAYTLVIPLALLAGLLASRLPTSTEFDFSISKRNTKLVAVLVLLGLAGSTIWFIEAGRQRVVGLHVLTALLYGGCAFIAFSRPALGLSLSIVTGLQQRAMVYYSSVTQFGLDALFHQRMVARITAVGDLSPLAAAETKYLYSPLHHLFIVIGGSLTDFSARHAAFFTSGVAVTLLPPLVVYFLGRRYFTPRIGAIAGILFITTDNAISLSVRPRPLAFGFSLFPLIILFLVLYFEHEDKRFGVLALLTYGVVATADQFSTFTILLGLTIVCGIYYFSRLDSAADAPQIPIVGFVILYLSWTTAKIFGDSDITTSFFDLMIQVVFLDFLRASGRGGTLPASEHYVVKGAETVLPIQLYDMGVILAIAVAGIMIFLRSAREDTRLPLSLITIVGVFLAFALAGPLVGVPALQPHRWFVFIYVSGVVLGGFYLLSLDDGVFDPRLTTAVILCLVVSTALFAGANFNGAPDGAFVDSPGAERLTVNSQEDAGFRWATNHQENIVVSDYIAWQLLDRHYEANAQMYQYPAYGEPLIYDPPMLAVYRSYANTPSASYTINRESGGYWVVHGEIPEPRGSDVYDNDEVRIIYIR